MGKKRERETTPPVNVLGAEEQGRWAARWLSILLGERQARSGAESCVAYHKRVLGQQSFCWVGGSQSRRFYVWDRPLWRAYVHNEAGVSLEVPEGATSKDVWAAMADYRAAMRLNEQVPTGYEGELSGFGPVVRDGWCGEPIAWGFRIERYLGTERFNGLAAYGELECIRQGEWVLVTRWLTSEEASEKYGEVTDFEQGPRGGFRSVTYGDQKFINRRLRPSWL